MLPMLFAVLLLLACFLPHTAHAQGACGEWTQTVIGLPSSGSTQFDACAPGTITITSAGAGSSSADRQYMVQRELCGDGTIDVKIESISNGRAGLEIRADNTPGAIKAGLKTPLSNMLTRYLRNASGTAQSASSINAIGHRWLRLVRSGSNIQLFWSSTGVNWTSAALYTNMALPACARIGIFVESNNASVATGVFSNLRISGVNIPATTFSFAAGSLSADAGEEVQVCVNIANPCACAPASVQVALQGNAAPHLSGFSTQTLQFQSGDTQKCFSLSTADAPGDGSYTLILQNPTGGNDAAIGAQASVSVAVTGEPVTPTGCPWAGPDREICRGESVLIGCTEETPPAGTFYCYKWTPETGLDDPSLPQPTATPQETTTYTVYVTDNKGNLVATDGVLVRVKPLPELSLTSDPSPAIIVNGAPVELNATSGLASYSWELSGVGPVPNAVGHSIQASLAGDYVVSVTNEQGCGNSATVRVANGNDEDACAQAIRDFFVSKGFLELPVTIIGSDPGFTSDPEQARLKSLNPCLVQDEAQLLISLADDELNIATPLLGFLDDSNPLLEEFTGTKKGIVTHNDNFCLNLILSDCGITELSTESVEATFADVAFGYWAHVWKAPAGGGEDALFISARSPLSEHFWTTGDPLIVPEAKQASEYVKNRPLHPDAAFPSRDNVIVNNTFDILAATSIQNGINLDIPYSSSIADCITQTDLICLSSAGAPLRIAAGSVISFGTKAKFSDLIDPQALSRFTISIGNDLVGHYRGMVRLPATNAPADYFVGYKNLLTTKFYEYPGAAISGPQTVRLGVRVDQSAGCSYFYTYSLGFTPQPAYPPNQDRKAAGALVADFHNSPSGTFAPPSPDTYLPDIISLCPPPVSFEAFREPLAVQNDPQNSPAPNGWYFLVRATNGAIERFYAYYPPGTPELAYLRFTCNGWVPFDPPHRPTYDFLSALYQIFSELGHIVLDVAGMIPVIGEPADFVSGIWYTAEGNYSDAGFSFAALIPLLGAEVTAGKYVFKIADEAGNVRTLNKFLKAGKTAEGGTKLFKINGIPVNLADWLGIKTFQNNFSPQQAQKYAEWIINLKASGEPILKLFDESPAMFNAWKALDEAGASPAQWERLFVHLADLPANAPLLTRFATNPDIAKGWKLLDDLYAGTAQNRLWDGDLIAKTTELSNNTVLMERLGGDEVTRLSALKDIISKNALAGCNACLPPTNLPNAHLKSIDQYLDDVQYFITQLGGKPGAGTMISLMKNGAPKQIDAIAQTIRLLKENPGGKFAPGNVVRFEPKLSNTADELASDDGINQVGDILVTLASGANKLYELKSYIKSSLSGIPTGLLNQFKAYLNNNNVTNMSRLEYTFDQRKLLRTEFENLPNFNPANYFDDAAQAEQAIKAQFQVMMQQNASQVFQANPNLFSSFQVPSTGQAVNINNAAQFFGEIGTSHPVFSFIKVE